VEAFRGPEQKTDMVEIREIKESELKELLALYRHLHEVDDPLPEAPVVESVWKQIQAEPNQRYMGLFASGELVASCVLCIMPNLTRGCHPYGLVENVVTRTDVRRKGYGKALLKATLRHAWSRDCYKVMLLTGRKDEGVYQFYESAGFDRHAKQAVLAKPGPERRVTGHNEAVSPAGGKAPEANETISRSRRTRG
jgi:GNAT superfamily N-acetyltransferase